MTTPAVKIIAVSNVFSRVMHFKQAGDMEHGHKHTYDHATLVSSGSVRVDILDDNLAMESTRDFVAPDMIFVRKDKNHRLTALEDNTVCACIHALRTVEDDLVAPDFLIDSYSPAHKGEAGVRELVADKCGQQMQQLIAV